MRILSALVAALAVATLSFPAAAQEEQDVIMHYGVFCRDERAADHIGQAFSVSGVSGAILTANEQEMSGNCMFATDGYMGLLPEPVRYWYYPGGRTLILVKIPLVNIEAGRAMYVYAFRVGNLA